MPVPTEVLPEIPLGVGIDGAAGGWFYVALGLHEVRIGCVPQVSKLYASLPRNSAVRVFIDMPIGLSDDVASPRTCESEARRMLGPRRTSVFPVPARATLAAQDYRHACELNVAALGKSLSRQSYGILAKIRELDEVLQNDARARAITFEAHPELCFWALAGGHAMTHTKKTAEGLAARLDLLQTRWPAAKETFAMALKWSRGKGVAKDDIVDAMVNALSASQSDDSLCRIPAEAPADAMGLPMCINFSNFGYAV